MVSFEIEFKCTDTNGGQRESLRGWDESDTAGSAREAAYLAKKWGYRWKRRFAKMKPLGRNNSRRINTM
jgi:uncharacterized protein (DUF2147 family)